jgi:hypothetical protein
MKCIFVFVSKWVQMFSSLRVSVVELCIMCPGKFQTVIQVNDVTQAGTQHPTT